VSGSLIFQIRGAMGSGKTTLMRQLMDRMTDLNPVARTVKPNSSRPEAYRGKLDGLRVAVLGPYTATCGGMDAINSVDESLDLIARYATGRSRADLVLYEGMMLGHIYGRHGAAMIALHKNNHLFTFLNTPLDKCIQRVRERRAARGASSVDFDAKNVVQSFETVESSRLRILENGGWVQMLPHRQARAAVLSHINGYFSARGPGGRS
jgi:molybdopterin-guanine dinucleotide biosynthesis protein